MSIDVHPVRVIDEAIVIPTYSLIPCSALPPLFHPVESMYPYTSYLDTHAQPEKRTYNAIVLDNGLLRVTVLPELGGRIYQIEDAKTGGTYLHHNCVVRPVRIPPRSAFISLGIEFNFPMTHSPTGTDPVGFEMVRRGGGAGVAVGEREMRWGLCWRAEILLFPGFRGVCVSARAWNPTQTTRPVQWWSNAAQPAGADTEFIFPDEPVLAHIIGEQAGHWPTVSGIDRRWHRNYDGMCGLFWEPSNADFFGTFHHEAGWGLLHLADPEKLPGKKLWTFGQTGPAAEWTLGMTRGGGQSMEIQSGIPTLQTTHVSLEPHQDLSFTEFWIPIDSREALEPSRRPSFAGVVETLGGVDAISAPRLELDSPSGRFWKDLISAHARSDQAWLRASAGELSAIWPPTGLDLEPALRWAAHAVGGHWRYPLALWFCAQEQWPDAEQLLRRAVDDCPGFSQARAMWGLVLWKAMNRSRDAWPHLEVALRDCRDGQLYVHANSLLRELGQITERQKLLHSWCNEDFRKRETAAEIAIDLGNAEEAIRILTEKPWKRHHGRHRRGELWQAARQKLGLDPFPVPTMLGEDVAEVNE